MNDPMITDDTLYNTNSPTKRGGERYSRQTALNNLGEAGQQKLRNAKVLVVGAGGLGVPVLQYLAGMGIGTIGIVDADTVSLSNLHRQILYSEQDINKKKVAASAERLRALNSEIKIDTHDTFLDAGNAMTLLSGYDVVVDATDNFSARYLLNDACVMLNKPCVYGAVQQYEGHVSVFNFNNGPTYRDLYPEPPQANEIPDCNTAGVLGVAPGIIGCQQALQVVKIITGIGTTLSGYLQIFDLLTDEQYKIKLKVRPDNKMIDRLQQSYETPVCNSVQQLTVEELYDRYEKQEHFDLIDVREIHEFEEEHLLHARCMPALQFDPKSITVDAGVPVILFCQKGARSNKAAQTLQRRYPSAQIFSVLGGMEYWQDEFDDAYLVKGPTI
ncbi:HesA/MoeB/ThiF family protein [Mucilaginibacter daejeonensis]|uniref:HesA/MoeB/ThiF family protein n=1 Tax=Mucilaginibacter daejeonensis TaxID=398049 RepID=UPI001D179022|nr:HesA/MoeB/ThiF family protein [Mucilaginibacter daejeonensis]UEG53590.1 HesA/MoeB/ThiF family protein [Mucilaginibacter daejeonensis]